MPGQLKHMTSVEIQNALYRVPLDSQPFYRDIWITTISQILVINIYGEFYSVKDEFLNASIAQGKFLKFVASVHICPSHHFIPAL